MWKLQWPKTDKPGIENCGVDTMLLMQSQRLYQHKRNAIRILPWYADNSVQHPTAKTATQSQSPEENCQGDYLVIISESLDNVVIG